MALGAAPGGLPPVGAQAVLLGMQQFNQSVRQVSSGLGQINSASLSLERNSTLAMTRMTTGFASMSSAYVTGGANMAATFGLMEAGIAGVAVAVVAVGASAVASAASFEKAMTPVKVFGDLSKQQTDQLSDSVLNMSRTWGVAANSIAAGETALVKAGATFSDLNGPLSEAVTLLNVASEGELSMAESADIVTQGMRSWRLSTAEAIPFVNALVGATNASTAGFRGMVQGLGQSQSMAAAVGVSYRDLFAVLGTLNDENIRGERAGTAYRNLLLRMLSPTKDVAGVMVRYNLSLSDANGNMITAREFVERMSNAFSDQATAARGLSEATVNADLSTLGMSRSLLGALAIANQGTAAFDKYQRAIDKTDVRKIAEAFTANTVKQAGIFAANINAIGIAFGEPFNEGVGRAINSINKWLQSIDLKQVRTLAIIISDTLGNALSTGATLAGRFFELIAQRGPALEVAASGLAKLADTVLRTFSGAGSIISDLGVHVSNAIKFFDVILTVIGTLAVAGARAFSALNVGVTSTSNAVELTAKDISEASQFIVNAIADFVAGVITAGNVAQKIFGVIADAFHINTSMIGKDIDVSIGNLDTYSLSWSDIVNAVGTYLSTLYTNFKNATIAVSRFISDTLSGAAILVDNLVPLADRFIDFYSDMYEGARFYGKKTADVTLDTYDTMAEGLRGLISWSYKGLQLMNNLFPTGGFDKSLENFAGTVKDWPGIIETATSKARAEMAQLFDEASHPDRTQMKQNFAQTAADIQVALLQISQNITKGTEEGFQTVEAIASRVHAILDQMPQDFALTQVDVRKFFNEAMEAAKQGAPAIDAWIAKLREAVQVASQGITVEATQTKLPGSNRPETEGVGFPVDQAKAMQSFVANLLREIPALTDEFTEFIAKLAEADPNRLNGMIAALMSQRGVLQDIGRIRLEILQTEIKIAEVDARLDDIHRQQQRIQIQMQQASLPFEKQLLDLRTRSLQIEAQMLPLQNAMADIDSKIALLQRENLGLRMRELQIRAQMMPIENAIADIDRKIADTQRVNYEWAIKTAQIQLQMLPIQNAIEDIEQQIARNNQENYALTRERLLLEQASLPIRREIENIDKQIEAAQQRNFARESEELRLQGEVLSAHQEMAQIDRQIASYGQTNYEIARQLADLDKQALPYRQQIARLEQQITDIVDKRAQLERDRTSLIAEHDLKSTERSIKQIDAQLDALWTKFGTTKGTARSALIPQIIDLEKQKKDLQDALKPAQVLVDTLKDQQDEINYNNELTKIGLQIQQAEQEALLAPINAQIAARKQQQEQEEATNAVIIAILNQQKAAIQANIAEQEEQLALLREIAEVEEHAARVTVLALEQQKQGLQAVLNRYDEQLLSLRRLEEEQKLATDIANTFLEEQAQRLKTILERYENELTVIQRQQQAYNLRNEIVRLGLEQEKSRLEALLRVWQDQLTAVERERAAEELRNQIAITGLEQQKRNIENLLTPLENAKRAIEQQTAAITAQQQLALAAYQQQLLALQASELENSLYKNQLEALRATEQSRLSALIQGFMNALINSGAFTSGEVIESVKRLNLWQGEVDKLTELKTSYINLQTQLSNTAPYGSAQTAMNNLNNVIPGLSNSLNTMSTNASSAFTNVNNVANALNGATAPTTNMYNGINSLAAVFNTMQSWAQVAREKVDAFTNAIIASGPRIDNEIIQVHNLGDAFNSLKDSITNAAGALSQYGAVAAKNIATEATANAMAQAEMAYYRAQGQSFEAAGQNVYRNILYALTNKTIGFANGGFVGGALNAPQMAIVHGGEYVVSRPEQRQLTAAITRAITTYNQQQTTVNYNFSASYERQQDPVTASMDMRALIEMTR